MLVMLPAASQALQASDILPPEQLPFDLQLLDFSRPTTIQGRVRAVDLGEQAIWLDWDRRLEEQPSGGKVWRRLEGEFMLLVYPRDEFQFNALKGLPPGTKLQMVIQSNEQGRRLILSYQDSSLPPEAHL
ncbi:MAG: hypothetical protein C4294_04615 [Nitrospiraceae bacterium]